MNREEIKQKLRSLDFDALIPIWNEYCDNNNDFDSRIFCNDDDELNEMFGGMSVCEILRMASYGKYNYTDDYCSFNGYGNLVSFNGYLEEDNCPISIDDLATWFEDDKDLLEEYGLNDDEEEEDEDNGE